ncbi:anti-sigma factor antagonist [Acrocarpospora corrugata]|uniref:Anti-sigma factor antagonist n=1 Tax=Acrocarpospora corrugata TaxID=35763 RepID=A0A5M3WC16_9ACTN|nr:STAS domain-containing protein [Acrocarpospora corrugata]GES05879.1 anti-sigma factor antagonist [Acrocarpospora corrugata]
MSQAGHDMPDSFSTIIGLRSGVVIVRLSGELDLFTVSHLRLRLREAAAIVTPPQVVLDVEDLTFCDSTGLGALLAALRESEKPGRFALSCVQGRLARVLKVTGLEKSFDIHPTADMAVGHLTGPT